VTDVTPFGLPRSASSAPLRTGRSADGPGPLP